MGKSKGKKKKSEFDDFFAKKEEGDGAWVSGVSAMAMDDDGAAARPAQGEAADMEVGDAPSGPQAAKGSKLGVQRASMKVVRGQRTKAQKIRKLKKVEKAEARAAKTVVRVGVMTAHKQKKSTLKNIY